MRNKGAQTIFLSDFFLSGRPATFRPGLCRSRKAKGGPRWLQLFVFLTFTGMAAGAAHGAGQLTFSPSAANFGAVNVGSSKTIEVTITNTGSTTAVLKKQNLSGDMYAASGITPISIAPGAHVMMAITFQPTKAGPASGDMILTSGFVMATMAKYSLSGTGVAAAGLQASPGSVAFGNVTVGTKVSQSVQLKNPGTGSATISSVSVSGGGFSTSGLTLPVTLAARGTQTLTLTFAPTAIGAGSGTITLKSSSGAPELTLNVSGTGLTGTRTISAWPASLNFGSAVIGSAEKLAVTLQNTGNSNLRISGVSVTGLGVSSISSGLSGSTIAPGQTATLNVTFAPKNAGRLGLLNGSVKISSNATNSPTVITLNGTAVSETGHSTGGAQAHSVFLSWNPSTSSDVVGYNVYRTTSPGPPFAKLVNSTQLSYADETVKSGKTYTYVVTAVDSAGDESVYSASVTAAIP
jgi:P pilus assembly chaperone PapD